MPMYGRTVVNPDSIRSASVLATITTVPFGLGWLLGAGWSVIAPPRGSRPDLLILQRKGALGKGRGQSTGRAPNDPRFHTTHTKEEP